MIGWFCALYLFIGILFTIAMADGLMDRAEITAGIFTWIFWIFYLPIKSIVKKIKKSIDKRNKV